MNTYHVGIYLIH